MVVRGFVFSDVVSRGFVFSDVVASDFFFWSCCQRFSVFSGVVARGFVFSSRIANGLKCSGWVPSFEFVMELPEILSFLVGLPEGLS